MAERIVVGLSGGVDSSVAAALLVEQGFDVVGVTLRVWPWRESDDAATRFGSCCSPATVDDARQVARRLGIPYYLLNSAQEFEQTVIADFAREYEAGRTPVPCTVCNREIKFGTLLHRAQAWDAAAVATGHYARITRDPRTERFFLWRGADARKDQSDFLWPLSQAQLGAARFPVGALTKPEVRDKARTLGLVTAEKPESQEICFIPDDDYRSFLRARIPDAFRRGPIMNATGQVVGEHEGLANYTVGQRRGLGLALGRTLYVTALDPARNAVVVGNARDVDVETLVAEQTNWIAIERLEGALAVTAQIRHRHEPARAALWPLPNGRVEVRFETAQRAPAPGQSIVFYDGDLVVGGGVISRRQA